MVQSHLEYQYRHLNSSEYGQGLCDGLYYFAHHNWRWAIEAGLGNVSQTLRNELNVESAGNIVHCTRTRDLPSGLTQPLKPQYSLFKVEIVSKGIVFGVWATSRAFEFLESKDSLYKHLSSQGLSYCMPETILLPWDIGAENSLSTLPYSPMLLKAACGSGGFGLYFVYSPTDVVRVIEYHAKKAIQEPGFLEKLRASHGGLIPMWSLQRFVSSSRIQGHRSQIRAYVVYSNGMLFLYNDIEVRIPSWGEVQIDDYFANIDIRAAPNAGDYDTLCCEGTTAHPYNLGRIKAETRRFMLEEIPEIADTKYSILLCLRRALLSLKCQISSQDTDACNDRNRVAVAGIDVVLEESFGGDKKFDPKILELNNNPAMPSEHKCMSDLYKAHLKNFVSSTVALGFGVIDHDRFEEL